MNMQTTVRKIGNSYGIILPKEALHTLKVKEGDALYLTDSPCCSLRVSTKTEELSKMMAIAERGMNKYRNALQELAK